MREGDEMYALQAKVFTNSDDSSSTKENVGCQAQPGLRLVPPKWFVHSGGSSKAGGKSIPKRNCHDDEHSIHFLPEQVRDQRHNQSVMYRPDRKFGCFSTSTHGLHDHITGNEAVSDNPEGDGEKKWNYV